MISLAEQLKVNPFQGYAYAYPHKLAYRPLNPVRPLGEVWKDEPREARFLYVHVPFCEMRCGFCNLFTTTGTPEEAMRQYLAALERQMAVTQEHLSPMRIARAAIGGGTPTILPALLLERLFHLTAGYFGPFPPQMPVSCEVSPATVEAGKLAILRAGGVTRVSIGVQSFIESETRALGRPQSRTQLDPALELLREAAFPILNLDLIYGIQGQTEESWALSLRQALHYQPQELYLYPLYVRPLTGLDRLHRPPADNRLELYRFGRNLLLAEGFEQISMRLFRKRGVRTEAVDGPVYCCQEDGMIGLGAGARSYTQALHYSTEYAVGRTAVQHIIQDFTQRQAADFALVDYGCELSVEEQKRRFFIKSLLRQPGLSSSHYLTTFGNRFQEDFPVGELVELGLAEWRGGNLALTTTGLESSDAIGPWFFSAEMQQRMAEYELV
jgi:oxygen-independent coproporphyrinogen-3 oxidase